MVKKVYRTELEPPSNVVCLLKNGFFFGPTMDYGLGLDPLTSELIITTYIITCGLFWGTEIGVVISSYYIHNIPMSRIHLKMNIQDQYIPYQKQFIINIKLSWCHTLINQEVIIKPIHLFGIFVFHKKNGLSWFGQSHNIINQFVMCLRAIQIRIPDMLSYIFDNDWTTIFVIELAVFRFIQKQNQWIIHCRRTLIYRIGVEKIGLVF